MKKLNFDTVLMSVCAIVIICCLLSSVSGKTCRAIQKQENIIQKQIREPCTVSYKGRCGWFSLSYCTFYRPGYCNKAFNETITTYYNVTKCCKGYIRIRNMSCIDESKLDADVKEQLIKAAKEISTETPVYVIHINNGKNEESVGGTKEAQETKQEKVESKDDGIINLSHGAYAGIACAVLFIGVVIVLTAIRLKKRHKRRPRKKSPRDIEQAAQRIALHDPDRQQEATAQDTEAEGETVT